MKTIRLAALTITAALMTIGPATVGIPVKLTTCSV